MKRTKKILSALLAAVLVCTAAIPVLAADTTEISYTQEASFTASIPAFVRAAEPGQQDVNAYTITATDVVIPDNSTLSATVEYSGAVRDKNGVEIPYTLYTADGAVTSGDTILQKEAGDPSDTVQISFGASIDEKARYAGAYTDTATFTFSVDEKVYTADEIEADEHLFAIGQLNPEDVVAKFNDDFSEVVIFANGENSNGAMKLNFSSSSSPMSQHQETLKTAVIQEGVVNIGASAFWECSSLESVSIANSVTSIRIYAFYKTGLSSVSIPDSVTNIEGDAFLGCFALQDIIVDDNNPTYCSVDGVLFSKDKKTLCIYPSGRSGAYNVPEGTEVIRGYAFDVPSPYEDYSKITSVRLPDSITTIETAAFRGCASLQEINIPDFVTSIGESAFSYCQSLKSISIPSGITKISKNCFSNCTSLDSVQLPDRLTEIDNYAFDNCTQLTSITIPDSVTRIGFHGFYIYGNLTVYGYAGSYAETWANSNSYYTFIAL